MMTYADTPKERSTVTVHVPVRRTAVLDPDFVSAARNIVFPAPGWKVALDEAHADVAAGRVVSYESPDQFLDAL